ncbi:gibberellin 2-beta-dioxygenase 2 [Nicotiana tabacum]|uniref:gibberellin 2beta-dioxygenase n=1 Tax=Nicotiana tabacum TaxID=4097 RepID=A0A1S3WXA7_TOBAC|nr:PREDICTED: gibberellin 2-beta-dioxygenase 2-like [Nicotiana tabacum]
MVVATPNTLRRGNKKTTAFGIPTIDLSEEKSKSSEMIVKACEDYGFFKVTNHGVPNKVIARMEREAVDFFSRPVSQKRRAGPATPFGYGCKNIGFNGDKGDLEYILLEANPLSLSQRSKTISNDPSTFSCVANDYVNAVKNLACDILELVAEGLRTQDKSIFSNLISDSQNDSCFRINHYPPLTAPNHQQEFNHNWDPSPVEQERLHISPPLPTVGSKSRIGFGEHTDPQILTILRSNDVNGLQICSHDGFWIPVPPDPNEFFVFVGDSFQALTNGRFTSVRHRVVAMNSWKTRMSMMYFAAPALDAWITSPSQIKNKSIISTNNSNIYRPFTWGQLKQIVYSLRLADSRLDHFKNHTQ